MLIEYLGEKELFEHYNTLNLMRIGPCIILIFGQPLFKYYNTHF